MPIYRVSTQSPPPDASYPQKVEEQVIPEQAKLDSPARQNDHPNEEALKLVQDQQKTISLLVSEKAALADSLERLEGADASMLFILRPSTNSNSSVLTQNCDQ